ncbi:MAG: DNA starvation/stationary phase protection protein [Alphaproteobacteria bacterium]|nr:DNA starvation/stationary phase protection protein [Alphaproteobacteria bacterium]MBU0794387.1 DNA starvation/stationary phase protection protein [Alphaproteobacteria bacterium]MBU0874435.1 DNA starvation/stationary phase protection protein [Alphaproteobacteria bacterium]MBU1768520.1 DNA starvation/stationary phase protection protein [Alphaproteobacteria bacterium]
MANSALKAKPKDTVFNTGIERGNADAMAEKLGDALADSFSLYLKTLGVHWNVVGPSFFGLHKLTEAQYEDLAAAIDLLAERIRALGHLAPAAFGDYARRSVVESDETVRSSGEMIDALIKDNEAVARRLREAVATAEEADDVFTADMLTARIGKHEENVWMLRAVAA